MTDRFVASGDLQLRTESFGNPSGTPLLLIMGASAPGCYWRDEFVDGFVRQGCYVIRYDNRDTGRSTCLDFSSQPYTLDDLAMDAVAVLDAYGLKSAHVAGASMGGMIVQVLMLRHRSRLRSATIIMSSPLAGSELGADDLPAPDASWMQQFMAVALSPATSREDQIDRKVKMYQLMAGSAQVFDEARQRAVASIEVAQASNLDAAMNHTFAIGASSPKDRRELLKTVDVPTLVIHGTEDPILPYAHGVALVQTIRGAQLMTLARAGHEIPRCYVTEITDRMLALQASVHE
jgi:pimeloyl-ACP methyl ester carboxylesterase